MGDMTVTTIDIDFEVYKELTLRRATESVTYNDVLRELLKLGPAINKASRPSAGGPGDWTPKGVRFPEGTEFRARYKGQIYLARVEKGALVRDGKRFDSPSAAAKDVTQNFVNGWTFWECRFPGESTWKNILPLRNR
jgi:hypothetical protein